MPFPKRVQLPVLAVLAASACSSGPVQPDGLPLGRPFDLRMGQAVIVEGGLSVAFKRVESDSRCAIDAICVWEGDAVLSLTLSTGMTAQQDVEIHTQPAQSVVVHGGHQVSLSALAPYPRSDRPTPSGDYVATLTVTPR